MFNRPSPQQSPSPGMTRPSPQQSPQPNVWGAGQTQGQQAFSPSQAFPPTQDFPPQQHAFAAQQQAFDSPAFPPTQPQQNAFDSSSSSPFASGPAQATSTPNQTFAAFGQQQQQQSEAFGGVKVASDPFKDDPFFSSSSTPPPTAPAKDKYAVFSEEFSQPSSVFGDSSAFGGGSGSVFDNTAATTNGASSAGGSTMNNAFGTSSPTLSGKSGSPAPTPQRNGSSDNLFKDLDEVGGKKGYVDKSEFFKQPPKPSMAQLGPSGGTPPPTGFTTSPANNSATMDPFGSSSTNVSDQFNQPPFANQSLEDKTHDPFDTSNIVIGPKAGPFDTSQLKPKQAESPPVQQRSSHKPNELPFSTPEKTVGAFEDSFTLPSPDAPPPPLPREASLQDAPAPTPPPRPTFARAATIDMTSGTLPSFAPSSQRSKLFGRQATVDMGDLAPPPAIPPRPADSHAPNLPPRPNTSASVTSNSSPLAIRRSSCTTPPLPPRPLGGTVPITESSLDRHPSPQTTASSASSSHEPSPHHHHPTAGTVSRARPRPRPRTPGSASTTSGGSLTLTKLTEQPSAAEHMQETFVRDTQIRQSDNIQLTARRLASKTLVRNQSEPMFGSSLPDGFRDSFRASPADFSAHSSGSEAFPTSFPPPDSSSARSQTPSEHSMDTDRVSESLTFDSARSHTDSPAFHSRSDPFPQDFDPFGDEEPKDPFSESPEEEVFTTKAVTVEPDSFADPFGSDPFASDPFESRPKSGSSLGNQSNADTSSQYSDCRSTHESHSHSNSDSQADAAAQGGLTLPKEALSHWESFSERPTPTEADKTVVDKFAAAEASTSSESKDDALNTNGLTNTGEIRRDPFGSLDPLTSVDIKAKLQIKENLQIKEELQWAFSNKKQQQPPEENRDWSASGTNPTNQIDDNTASTTSSVQLQNQNCTTTGPSDHVSGFDQSEFVAQAAPAETQSQNEGWASDDAFHSSSQQPFAAFNGGGNMAQPTAAFGQMSTAPPQQQMPPSTLPRQQSVGNPFAPNNQVCTTASNLLLSCYLDITNP